MEYSDTSLGDETILRRSLFWGSLSVKPVLAPLSFPDLGASMTRNPEKGPFLVPLQSRARLCITGIILYDFDIAPAPLFTTVWAPYRTRFVPEMLQSTSAIAHTRAQSASIFLLDGNRAGSSPTHEYKDRGVGLV